MSFRLIGVVAVVMTIGSMFLIPHVARIFVGYDAGLLTLTTHAFRLYALSFLIMGFNVYASSFFTALGDGVTSASSLFCAPCCFRWRRSSHCRRSWGWMASGWPSRPPSLPRWG